MRKDMIEYDLVWSEEFDSDSLNTKVWNKEASNPFQNEIQSFVAENTQQKNGHLELKLNYNSNNTPLFQSGAIKGLKSFESDSGYVEIKLKPIGLEGIQNRVYLKNSLGQVLGIVKINGGSEVNSAFRIFESERNNFDFSKPFSIHAEVGVSEKYITSINSIQTDFLPQSMFIDYIKIFIKKDQELLF